MRAMLKKALLVASLLIASKTASAFSSYTYGYWDADKAAAHRFGWQWFNTAPIPSFPYLHLGMESSFTYTVRPEEAERVPKEVWAIATGPELVFAPVTVGSAEQYPYIKIAARPASLFGGEKMGAFHFEDTLAMGVSNDAWRIEFGFLHFSNARINRANYIQTYSTMMLSYRLDGMKRL